jgi:hypothetical protein
MADNQDDETDQEKKKKELEDLKSPKDLPQRSSDTGEKPKVKTLSYEATPGKKFAPDVERAIESAAQVTRLPVKYWKAIASIESSGEPGSNRDRRTQYKGLFQIGRDEWARHGKGDIYNADDNAKAMARLTNENMDQFKKKFGRDPTPGELYLTHLQGLGFHTKGIMTNVSGNAYPGMKGPQSKESFQQGWTREVERRAQQRGGDPSMRKTEADLPSGYLSNQPLATQEGHVQGGVPDTPEAQSAIAALYNPEPLDLAKGTKQEAEELASDTSRTHKLRKQELKKLATTKEQRQVSGELPTRVNQTETLPIPGMEGRDLMQAASGPSLLSTIMNENELRGGSLLPKVEQPNNDPTFMDKLTAAMNVFSPIRWTAEGLKTAQQGTGNVVGKIADNEDAGARNAVELGKGVGAGAWAMPQNVVRGVAAPVAGAAGLLLDSPGLKQWAAETNANAEDYTKRTNKFWGVDPTNEWGSVGNQIGGNAGFGLGRTAVGAAVGALANSTVGPLGQYLGKNYPIPSLVSPAQAATVFGRPPTVINTPSGPVVMNDATLSGLVYGGAMALGFGYAVSSAPRVISWAKEARLGKTSGLHDVYDPRRIVPGTERAPNGPTIASSIPADILKAGIVDQGKAMLDIADRQARYESATGVGIDPIAADAVNQKWRIQTNSGAQNMIAGALVDGKLNADEYRFHVDVPMSKIGQYAAQFPQFADYVKLQWLKDQLDFNRRKRAGMVQDPALLKQYPKFYVDHNNDRWGAQNVGAQISRLEADNPDFVTHYGHYQDNLAETRKFVTSHSANYAEDAHTLQTAAMERKALPVFTAEETAAGDVATNPKNKTQFERVMGGESPLHVAETEMRRALAHQMKIDAEQNYINVSNRSAFTPRNAEWVNSSDGAVARRTGAVLQRRIRGGTEYWTADPLLVSVMNSGQIPLATLGKTFARFKSVFQSTTTGLFAPWFAVTGAVRAMEQGWTNAPSGVRNAAGRTIRAAGPLSTPYAIAAQLTPRALNRLAPTVKWFETAIQNTDLGRHMIDPKYHNLLSRVMKKAYDDSFYKVMKEHGAYSGQTLQHAKEIYDSVTQQRLTNKNAAMNPIHDYMQKAQHGWMQFIRPIKAVGHVANESLRAVQEAPNYAWAYKVGKGSTDTKRPTINGRPMSNAELAARMRNYTGDPSTRGYIYTGGSREKTLRFSDPNTATMVGDTPAGPIRRGMRNADLASAKARADLYTVIAQGAHDLRTVTPWSGVLLQSPASTIEALRANPLRANLAFIASSVLPEMTAYMWNAYHSNEENDYVDYMMYGRSDYNLMNNTYFAIPGNKPYNGIEFRQFQETILPRHMTRAVMQQYMGKSTTTIGEDVQKALEGFTNGVITPPQPSWAGLLLAASGVVSPNGWTAGYQKRNNQYLELGGGESTGELMFRAIAPSIADISLQGLMAFRDAPTVASGVGAAFKQVGNRMAARTALVGEAIGVRPDPSMSPVVAEELRKKQKTIDDLAQRFRIWDAGKGAINLKPKSGLGGSIAEDYMGDLPPADEGWLQDNPGLPQPPPKNPLYGMLMQEIYNTFKKDVPSKGGAGFQSMWRYYQIYSTEVSRMRTVHYGNSGAWVAEQLKHPKTMQWLRSHKVNPLNFNAVRKFYIAKHNEAATKILRVVRATEQKLDQLPEVRKQLGPGKQFTIDMLDPRTPGMDASEAEPTQ